MIKKLSKVLIGVSLLLLPALYYVFAATTGTIVIWTGKASRNGTTEFEIREPSPGSPTGADFIPGADNTNSLGTSSLAWDDIQTYDLTVKDDMAVTDDLTVSGSASIGEDITLSAATGNDIIWGSGAAISTATTSGTSRGLTIPAYLDGDTDVVEGHVVISTTPSTDSSTAQGYTVILPVAADDNLAWAGVVQSATSTGSVVNVYYKGFVLARTTGTVNPGQTLVTSSDAQGYLEADASPSAGGVVGVALAAGTASGGLTLIQIR